MTSAWILKTTLLLPVLLALLSLLLRSGRAILRLCVAGTLAVGIAAGATVYKVFRHGAIDTAHGWLRADELSAFHMIVLMAVFVHGALYSSVYFRREADGGWFSRWRARRYGLLWFGALAAMLLVLTSNNLGMQWVGVEATTLLTAFMICIHTTKGALEAMWKYLMMCSVGVAMAFAGILLVAASTSHSGLHGVDAMMWTQLLRAGALDPLLLKAGFIFMVVGYGTKVGLAPMHNWLPDAHSQAPSPVSSIFSGFLLNTALYCILRILPVVNHSLGESRWAGSTLVLLGVISVLVAAGFIMAQKDLKRMLAYSSVEHMGIIALGVGLGGIGTYAALFHILNHSLSKTLAFSCAGTAGQMLGDHQIAGMRGLVRRSRIWGGGLVAALMSLMGVAPFAIFMSEFLILKAALDTGAYLVATLFVVGITVVFVAVLRHVLALGWAEPDESANVVPAPVGVVPVLLVSLPVTALLVMGFWLPSPISIALGRAARIVGGGG